MIDIIDAIARADEREIEQLLNAVLDRYAVLFPDWEVSTVSIQKSLDRNRQLDGIIAVLQRMKDIS